MTPGPADVLHSITVLLGGDAPAMAFGLVAATGLVTLPMAARNARSPRARTTLAVAVMAVAALLFAWLASQISPAWASRYLSVIFGPLILLGAAGLARSGPQGIVAVVVLVVLWLNPRIDELEGKSNAHDAAVTVQDRLRPGDLVVASHPEQVPVMDVYLPAGLRWATAMGPVPDPQVMDWRDAMTRFRRAQPASTADAYVRSLRPGQRLLLVQPIIRGASWRAAVDATRPPPGIPVGGRAQPRPAPRADVGQPAAARQATAQGRAHRALHAPLTTSDDPENRR